MHSFSGIMFHKGGDGKPRGIGFGGFSMPKTKGPGNQLEEMNFTGTGSAGFAGRTIGGHMNIGKKRVRSEEEYELHKI